MLKVIPFYTGKRDIDEVLKDRKSLEILWMEILLNGNVKWESYLNNDVVKGAYEKACIWYDKFGYMIGEYTGRHPLPVRTGVIDKKEYRKFIEALAFVSS